ncbi:hypothetical protein niasHT_027105 [Heterodera trifolii]|uniref:Uncharacterized protein n=1 Tax=Heterodera trifolii TaxID=157864 RepID=A0ABD2JCR1_9BILA
MDLFFHYNPDDYWDKIEEEKQRYQELLKLIVTKTSERDNETDTHRKRKIDEDEIAPLRNQSLAKKARIDELEEQARQRDEGKEEKEQRTGQEFLKMYPDNYRERLNELSTEDYERTSHEQNKDYVEPFFDSHPSDYWEYIHKKYEGLQKDYKKIRELREQQQFLTDEQKKKSIQDDIDQLRRLIDYRRKRFAALEYEAKKRDALQQQQHEQPVALALTHGEVLKERIGKIEGTTTTPQHEEGTKTHGQSLVELIDQVQKERFDTDTNKYVNLKVNEQVATINMIGATWIKNIKITVQGREIYDSNSLYAYKAYLDAELSYSKNVKESDLQASGYYVDSENQDGTDTTQSGFELRRKLFSQSQTAQFITKLDADVFNQDRYMVNGVEINIQLTPNDNEFMVMAAADDKYKIEITSCKLYVKNLEVVDGLALDIQKKLENKEAKYAHRKTLIKSTFISENRTEYNGTLFTGQLPKRVILGMVENAAYVGNQKKSPFNFRPFDVRSVTLTANGKQWPAAPFELNFSKNLYTRAFHEMNESLGMASSTDSNGITLEKYRKGWTIFAFNMTNSMEENECIDLITEGTTTVSIQFSKYPSALVVNNDPSNKEGTHWIAMFIVNDKIVYYFDSFGRTPNICEEKDFVFDGITKKSARRQMAYNGYKNVTVDQHFYVRHRICLRYANNPCVIEKHKNGNERFYPLELVKMKDDDPIYLVQRFPKPSPSVHKTREQFWCEGAIFGAEKIREQPESYVKAHISCRHKILHRKFVDTCLLVATLSNSLSNLFSSFPTFHFTHCTSAYKFPR